MAITRVKRLRDYGVFRDFAWPDDLPEFARYNLIYGWNGSGKTLLSRAFRALEKRMPPPMGEVILSISGCDVTGSRFPEATVPVKVFNRDFVNESVFPVGGADVPPIYVLGKENVERRREVQRLMATLSEAQTALQAARSRKQDADNDMDSFCIDRGGVIRDTLRSPGPNRYNNYDKADFRADAQNMATAADAPTHQLSLSDRDRSLEQCRATPKPKVPSLTYRLPALQALADAASELLSATVISSVIQSLKDDRELSEWTRTGLSLHRERNATQCLFCEQPLPANLLAALEAHFNMQYEAFMHRLDEQIAELQARSKQTLDLQLPNKAELYGDLAGEYSVADEALREVLQSTRTFLDLLAQALSEKKPRPFEPVPLAVAVPVADASVVDHVNEVIARHNLACDAFDSRVQAARDHLAADMVAAPLGDFLCRRDVVEQASDAAMTAEHNVQHLTAEIARLEGVIVEHRQPADELNQDLHKYLGHSEIQLEIKDTGYTITRNGVPAQWLSEGETTAIALLYFLKSLQDRRFDLTKSVVVLDDPVSSLDANALYLAFGFVRERTQDAAQLVIFTHNFVFFREVRNWFHHLKDQRKKDVRRRPARFYMVEAAHEGDGRSARIRWLDPLLEQYDSEYHYIFACIYRAAAAAGPTELAQNYTLPNLARRLLEGFLAFRQPQVSGELWEKVQAVSFDEAKKLRILRFLHTYSHGGAVGEPEHDLSLLSEAGSVLKDLLDMIRSQDADHFAAMVRLVAPPTEDEGDV